MPNIRSILGQAPLLPVAELDETLVAHDRIQFALDDIDFRPGDTGYIYPSYDDLGEIEINLDWFHTGDRSDPQYPRVVANVITILRDRAEGYGIDIPRFLRNATVRRNYWTENYMSDLRQAVLRELDFDDYIPFDDLSVSSKPSLTCCYYCKVDASKRNPCSCRATQYHGKKLLYKEVASVV